jgi:hypothetical protein
MQNRISLTALLAVAIALVLSPMRELQAAAPFGTSLRVETGVALAQARTKPGPGHCGTYNYWDPTTGRCKTKLVR